MQKRLLLRRRIEVSGLAPERKIRRERGACSGMQSDLLERTGINEKPSSQQNKQQDASAPEIFAGFAGHKSPQTKMFRREGL